MAGASVNLRVVEVSGRVDQVNEDGDRQDQVSEEVNPQPVQISVANMVHKYRDRRLLHILIRHFDNITEQFNEFWISSLQNQWDF